MSAFIFLTSFVGLILGADMAIDGSEKIGRKLRLSPLVIGVIFLGVGTSLPELFVTHIAALGGKFEIGIGNIFGSNLANIGLILGISGLLTVFKTFESKVFKQFLYHLLMTSVACIVIVFYGKIDFLFFALMMFFFVFYLWNIIFKEEGVESEPDEDFTWPVNIIKSIVGLILLYFGGKYLVVSVEGLAEIFSVEPYIISSIGLAFGTSFPELVTAIIAIRQKKNQNIIIGNIIGSNVFNMSLILGSTGAYIYPIEKNLNFEVLLLSGFSIYLLLAASRQWAIGKKTGLVFILSYFSIVFYWVS
jgi:cation:H+ antiporter